MCPGLTSLKLDQSVECNRRVTSYTSFEPGPYSVWRPTGAFAVEAVGGPLVGGPQRAVGREVDIVPLAEGAEVLLMPRRVQLHLVHRRHHLPGGARRTFITYSP
eukprot:9491911-Pyramimonas_sp.AAC.1